MLGKLEYGSITHNKLKFRLDIIYITVIFTLMKMQRIEQENYSICKTNEAEICGFLNPSNIMEKKNWGDIDIFKRRKL